MSVLSFLILIPAALLSAGFLYQAAGLALDRRRFPPPGTLIRSGNTSLHLHRQGAGFPTVVLEAGIGATSIGWALVQPRIAQFTTVCSYDRAGLGWSAAPSRGLTLQQMTTDLHNVLHAAQLPGPFVLVGHSFGGLLVRAFAARYPELTAGLVLVDPVSVALWQNCPDFELRKLRRGISLSKRGALLAQFGVVRAALMLLVSGSRILARLIGRAAAPGASGFMDRMVGQIRRLPPEAWPAVRAHWSDQKCFAAMAAHLNALPACAREAAQLPPPVQIPQTILSAETATADELAERDHWTAESGKHIRLTETGHWIQLDQPDAVIAAARELVDQVRSSRVI